MATLKDIAADTGLSASTVSIVLKGNGDTRKIKPETQQKVLEAAHRLGYKPNIQARVLRGGISDRMVITLFWASDIRVHMLIPHTFLLRSQLSVREIFVKLQLLMLQTRSSARDLFLTNKKNLLNYLGININSEVYRYGKN